MTKRLYFVLAVISIALQSGCDRRSELPVNRFSSLTEADRLAIAQEEAEACNCSGSDTVVQSLP